MKKIFIIMMTLMIVLSFCACSDNSNISTSSTNINETTTPQDETLNVTVDYTLDDIMNLKESWNKEYVFPCDIDKVTVTNKDDRNITMTLSTSTLTFEEIVKFYEKLTQNNPDTNTAKTFDAFFKQFDEDYVSRSFSAVVVDEVTTITITYTLDGVNVR